MFRIIVKEENLLGGSPLDIHASHCRVVCLLACWDRGPGTRETAEVWDILLRKEGKGFPLLCKHIPKNPEKKVEKYGLQSWTCFFFCFVVLFCCCCSLLPSASNLSALVTKCLRKGKDFWNMVADSALLWVFLPYTDDFIMARVIFTLHQLKYFAFSICLIEILSIRQSLLLHN